MGTSRYKALEASRVVLARASGWVSWGVIATGVSLFLDQVRPLVSDAQFTWGERRVMGIVAAFTLGGFGLGGWLAGKLLKASADLIEVFIDGAEAAGRSAYLIEAQLVPALARVSLALERLADGPPADPAGKAAVAVRKAIGEGRWGRSEQLIGALRPGDPETKALRDELARARAAEADDLRARLEAARARDDPETVVACRDALTQHLRGQALKDLDDRVVRWLSDWIQSKAKSGPVTPELAGLAERGAESFGDTPEGAALLAALPNLRRRAGLCPLCATAYRGSADACPECVAEQMKTTPRPKSGGAIPRGKP